MDGLKRMWRNWKTYDLKKDQAVSDNFYRYLIDLDSM